VVKNISENLIAQISETVARQTRQYLFSHPDLRKENFNRDIYFKKVVLQKIGLTGSTSLYETAGDKDAWLTWADVNPSLVGKNMKSMTGELGSHFQAYWDIVTSVKSGEVSSGVFKWPDAAGNLRDKFVVCTPVEGTPFVISASIFMDEITAPLEKIEVDGYMVAGQIRMALMVILGGGLLLIFMILLVYGRSLTAKIKRLADWADAISLGRLDSKPVNLNSRDEIGELTEAITRMQESIKLSIERLGRKR
jgi:HAMP domain-containing protein